MVSHLMVVEKLLISFGRIKLLVAFSKEINSNLISEANWII